MPGGAPRVACVVTRCRARPPPRSHVRTPACVGHGGRSVRPAPEPALVAARDEDLDEARDRIAERRCVLLRAVPRVALGTARKGEAEQSDRRLRFQGTSSYAKAVGVPLRLTTRVSSVSPCWYHAIERGRVADRIEDSGHSPRTRPIRASCRSPASGSHRGSRHRGDGPPAGLVRVGAAGGGRPRSSTRSDRCCGRWLATLPSSNSSDR
jgi:hypothetical protein